MGYGSWRWWRSVVPALLLAACDEPAPPPSAPPPSAPEATPSVAQPAPAAPDVFRFINRAAEAGIDLQDTCGREGVDKLYLMETIGSGAALLDYDKDGRLDVFLANGCELENRKPVRGGGCALYRNLGSLKFANVTDKAHARVTGMCNGALAHDFDNDGDTDLLVTRWDTNVLLRNNGDGTFADVSQEAGIVIADRWSASAGALDYDLDGDLDVYVANYFSMGQLDPLAWDKVKGDYVGLVVPWGPKGMVAEADEFLENQGGLRFRDVAQESGILDAPATYSLGVVTLDLDADGWPDVYVANDSTANQLWHNEASGSKRRFKDIGLESGVAFSEDGRAQAGMGVAAGDFDHDGLFDLFVTNFALDYNTLYHNQGGGLFADITRSLRFGQYQYLALAWGTAFVDFDLDGYLDLFVAAGHIYAQADQRKPEQFYRQHNMAFRNTGTKNYEDVSERSGSGLKIEDVHRGAAFGDLDEDGDVDVVVTVLNGKPEVLVNETERKGSFLQIRLFGKQSNRDGIGTKLWAQPDGGAVQLCTQAMSGGSFESSSDPRVHLGLGKCTKVKLRVLWPSQIETTYADLPVDALIEITEGSAAAKVVQRDHE